MQAVLPYRLPAAFHRQNVPATTVLPPRPTLNHTQAAGFELMASPESQLLARRAGSGRATPAEATCYAKSAVVFLLAWVNKLIF
jgi:hypothetical protein